MRKNNYKKLLWKLGGTISTVFPIAIAVSCGNELEKVANQDQSKHYATTDYSKINQLVESKNEEIAKAKESGNFKELRIGLITSGGTVDDKSFYQSIWEGVSRHSLQVGATWNKTVYNSTSDLTRDYNSFMLTDLNVWILSGYKHSNAFKIWYSQNKKEFDERDIIVIGIDLELSDSEVKPGKIITINFKSEEAGWMAGYAVADYLANTVADDEKRKVTTFGGSDEGAVTDFIAGYLTGIDAYNQTSDKKTKISSQNNGVVLDIGYEIAVQGTEAKLNNILTTNDPLVIFPVAGDLTKATVEAIKKLKKNQLVIGVDTDQSKAFEKEGESKEQESDSKYFFTSVEKRLGATIYRVLTDLWLKKGNKSDIIPDFEFNKTNANVKEGYKNDFVGISPTAITGENKVQAQKSLDKAKNKFEELVNASNEKDVKKILGIPEMNIDSQKGNEEKINQLVVKINSN
ncbi:BMP family ABC transporter substrate-binding protein [Mesomycoplasma lagogenitalium]|uniref:BMP family ABC transporter substrate-binding protein n=1 Tax=Mesomycoplasma lagogenitalium TaxID=171286 RepID=A0ABY8LT35_9BACT|nr:BMP family ABC transporter substrate-binding protein [Mesomycoplasma lagogenitalium]WGI36410.1 BMP family ABC transporter substrate-binding protein [Mesomycoplasma lagogenitalium]